MRRLYNMVAGCALLALSVSCEKDYSLYESSECYLNFSYLNAKSEDVTEAMATTVYSFAYAGEEVRVDTLWFEVETMGFLSDQVRPFVLKQFPVEGEDNAVPGVHYVAFDDADLVKFYRVPEHRNTVKIPVVLLRDDPKLREKAVVLKFGFVENEFFAPGYKGMVERMVRISDYLTQPKEWWRINMGSYGQEKHRLMILWTGELWDEEYILQFARGDSAYRSYMRQWLRRKLEEENGKRLADPEIGDVYREADGKAVSF